MAKEGLPYDGGYEPYCRRDPVSGQDRCFLRVRHNQIRSPRLEAFDACVSGRLRGRHYRGAGAAADEAAVRTALREAVAACAQHGRLTT